MSGNLFVRQTGGAPWRAATRQAPIQPSSYWSAPGSSTPRRRRTRLRARADNGHPQGRRGRRRRSTARGSAQGVKGARAKTRFQFLLLAVSGPRAPGARAALPRMCNTSASQRDTGSARRGVKAARWRAASARGCPRPRRPAGNAKIAFFATPRLLRLLRSPPLSRWPAPSRLPGARRGCALAARPLRPLRAAPCARRAGLPRIACSRAPPAQQEHRRQGAPQAAGHQGGSQVRARHRRREEGASGKALV